MGPMSVSRAVSLAAVVVVLLGGAIGLSHVGHPTVTGPCLGHGWAVVIGHFESPHDVPPLNTHASKLIANDCYGALQDPNGGWNAVATFASQGDAQAYADDLTKDGWVQSYGYQPVVISTPTR